MSINKTEKAASGCVKCGACTTVCPVFKVTGRESHTARGKHHIVENLPVSDRSPAFDDLISKCLLCGACQDSCALNLDTAQLVIKARSGLSRFSRTAFLKYLARKSLDNPALLSGLITIGLAADHLLSARLPRDSGMRLRLASCSRDFFPLPAAGFQSTFKSIQGKNESASACSYFVGCLANHVKPDIGSATTELVARVSGAPPIVPESQGCCGMASHAAGNPVDARRLAKKNIKAFEKNTKPILTSCASCYSHLKSYPELFAGDEKWTARARNFADRLLEFATFFVAGDLRLKRNNPDSPYSASHVLYHDPCHLRFKHYITDPPRRLLSSLEGVVLHQLAEGPQCCGQGGLFNVIHPDLSLRIADQLYDNFSKKPALFVVTTCSGCLIQWRQLLARHGSPARALHLAEFLRGYAAGRPGNEV